MSSSLRSRPLRVALLARAVAPLHGIGGLEQHVHDLVHHLLGRGVTVTLITRPPDAKRARADLEMPAGGLDVRFVPYRTFPYAGRRGTTVLDRSTAYLWFGERAGRLAADLAARGDVDIVHGLGASALGYARARRRRPRDTVPFVFNPQGLEEFGATAPHRARLKRLGYLPLQTAVRACGRAADRVIATDRSLVSVVLQHLKVPEHRVALVPNAVDLARCDRLAGEADGARLRRELGVGPKEHLLLSVGRIEKNKGFHELASALARLDAAGTGRPRWLVVGDGPFRSRLERIIGRCDLTDRTILRGRVDDLTLHACYEAATLFVHPTLYEGSSLVTLEAMAHRRAVVASAAGGLPDKVRPGLNGWLVEPGDTEAMMHALGAALARPERLRVMGEASREIAERDFSWPVIASRLQDLYGELVDEARSTRTARQVREAKDG